MKQSSRPIMIVEDDAYIQNDMQDVFDLLNRKIVMAKNGQHGIDILKSLRPHEYPCCIILDLMMPVMTGEEFIFHIQALGRQELDSIPIIVSSAHVKVDQMVEPRVKQKMRKPINLEDLENIANNYH